MKINSYLEGFSGLCVATDLHAHLKSTTSIISYCYARNLFLLLLGDIVDYGDDVVQTVDAVYNVVKAEKAILLEGNHENKIRRVLKRLLAGQSLIGMNITEGNQTTIDQIKALPRVHFDAWVQRFEYLMKTSYNYVYFDQAKPLLFAHAACHNDMLNKEPDSVLKHLATYGQHTDELDEATGYPIRLYDWVDDLRGVDCVVGHDILSVEAPVIKVGTHGSKVIFLDTGCSKHDYVTEEPGFASTATYLFNEEKTELVFEAFQAWK